MIVASRRKLELALCITTILASGLSESARAERYPLATHSPSNGALTRYALRPVASQRLTVPSSTILPVTSCADDNSPGTLRQVVGSASSGDTVDLTQLTCSAITLVSGQIEVAADELTLLGPGADALTIDGNHGAGYQNGRVFDHQGSGTLTIDHLTIANGAVTYDGFSSGYGGCINSNGSVTLAYSTVTGCSLTAGFSARGGGIYARGAVLVNHGEVTNNAATVSGYYAYLVSGGGIHCGGGGPLTITDSLIDGNVSEVSYDGADLNGITQAKGGGASDYFSLVTISGSVVSNNFAGCDITATSCYAAFAGGIAAQAGLIMESSTVSSNMAEGMSGSRVSGGGVYIGPGPYSTISYSTVSYNHAGNGGGLLISVDPASTLAIRNSTISSNSAQKYGGGIWVASGALSAANTTISENSVGTLSSGVGGGVMMSENGFAAPMTLDNSTVTANTSQGPDGGAGIVDKNTFGPSDIESSIIAGNVNVDSTATYDSDLGTASGYVTGANNLIIAANGVTLPPDTISVDPQLGPLQDNGGATWTHALLSGSPAIDAGNNISNLVWDQRGDGYPRVIGTSADIGAFEYFSGVDQPPTASDDSYTTNENITLKMSAPGVLDNDSDPDGDILTVILVDGPSNGSLTLNPDGSFVYVPAPNFSGMDSFTYEANDGQMNSNIATAAITITPNPDDTIFSEGFDGP